jgi:hypothetical protein
MGELGSKKTLVVVGSDLPAPPEARSEGWGVGWLACSLVEHGREDGCD